jgi:tripartite-type tricarboxylate transporter receptor subunit TctC
MTRHPQGRSRVRILPFMLVACAILAGGTVPSQAADYFEGKTIRLIVGNNEVGGYAVYARLLGQYLGRYIPGKPNVIVQYMPGGGGVTLGNYLANVAARDGLTIGMIPRSAPFQPLMGNSAAKFRAENFTWLGTTSSYRDDAYSLIVRSDTPYRTLADLQTAEKPVPFGGEAAGGTDTDMVLVAKNVFDLNIQLVRGYKGPGEIAMAMMRNEVVGRAFGMSSLQIFHADWLKEDKLRFLVQFRRTRWEKLPDVPTARELAQSNDQRALLELAETPLLLARPYLAPPQIPAEVVSILRKAFMDAHRDPEYLAHNAKSNSDVSPLDGKEVQDIVTKISHTPRALVERYKAALEIK